MGEFNLTIEKASALFGIVVALIVAIGGYFTIQEKVVTLSEEVEILRAIDNSPLLNIVAYNQATMASLAVEIDNMKMAAILAYQNLPKRYDDSYLGKLAATNTNRIVTLETQIKFLMKTEEAYLQKGFN
jgi:hypothetical protein